MTVLVTILIALLLAALSLALASWLLALRISRRHPAHGRFAEIAGLRIHHVDEGPRDDRLPVVVLHGASGSLDEPRSALGPVLPHRRAIYLDRPGHGYSERGHREMSAPAEQAGIVAGLLDHLGIDRAVVVGHSWGASVAAAFAVLHPERTGGLVFVAPATHPWPGGVTWYYRLSGTPLVGRLFAHTVAPLAGLTVLRAATAAVFAPDPVPLDYVERARVALVLRPGSFLANARDVAGLKPRVAAFETRYREIRAPAVIVTGDRDGVVWPSIHADGLARDIPGAELVLLPGTGHMPHHVHPQVIVDAIDRVTRRSMALGAVAPQASASADTA